MERSSKDGLTSPWEDAVMKRWLGGLLAVAVLLSFGTFVRSASAGSGSDVVWVTKQIPWNNKTGTAFTGAAKDTAYVTDENDTTRTDVVSTADWAFEAVLNGTAVVNVAYVTVTCRTNNGAADSVYYSIEKANRGVIVRNRTLAAAAGTCALLQGDARATSAVYRGTLSWDPDSPETINLLGPGDDFRLVVQGDQGGTTPKMSQTRIFVTYPQRRASGP